MSVNEAIEALKNKLLQEPTIIYVETQSRKNNLTISDKGFLIEIKAKAEHNKANEMIEDFISKKCGFKIKIISGKKTSKKKIKKI